MNFTAVNYVHEEMTRDVSKMVSVTIEESVSIYKYMLAYVANNLVDEGSNLSTHILSTKSTAPVDSNRKVYGRVELKLGIGEYAFRTYEGEVMYALHHMMGKPVGTDCGVKVLKKLILFSNSSYETVGKFMNAVLDEMEVSDEEKFICYTWRIRHQYWDEECKVNKRPMQSVVLPQATKDRLINDVTKFLSPKCKDFYLRNGIPYRRSYLFYGTPGTGKTSLVQALAAHFGRNVCFLLPTHPEMTDDSLRAAINRIPENSIVVFEDIDALFGKDRSNQIKNSSLTFSGLLNALDGIGSTNGQIFVLTTNLRENLDHALIRNGRVDMHFEFGYATGEQMELMWSNFYPDAVDRAVDFATAVLESLKAENLQVTTAGLQHFFVTQQDATVEEALQNVGWIVEEIKINSSRSMLEAAATTVVPAEGEKVGATTSTVTASTTPTNTANPTPREVKKAARKAAKKAVKEVAATNTNTSTPTAAAQEEVSNTISAATEESKVQVVQEDEVAAEDKKQECKKEVVVEKKNKKNNKKKNNKKKEGDEKTAVTTSVQ
jgi:DNA polymerase III delta prime subunit